MASTMTPRTLQHLADPRRLAALARSGVVDQKSDAGLQRISRMASVVLGVPVALVSLVDDQRQFFPGMVGLDGPYGEARETPLSHSFCQVVVRDGEPLIVPNTQADERFVNNPAIEDLGVVAYCGVPLTTEDGWRIGSLCVIDHEVREWTDENIAVLQDLAELVHTELRLRSRVDAAKQDSDVADRRREEAEDIARLANRLSPVLTTREIMIQVGTHLDRLGLAEFASLGTFNETGDALDLFFGTSGHVDATSGWDSISVDADYPVTVAARTGKTIVVRWPEDSDRWPEIVEAVGAYGIMSIAAFPLVDGSRTLIGALAVARADCEPLAVEHLQQITAVVGLALDRAWRREREARQARELQTTLLPSHPDGGQEFEVVVRYTAASNEMAIGGDWYDVVPLGEGRHALVVGDVSGHDLAAARAVARARHTIAALATAGFDPGAVLHAADAYIAGPARAMVTCAIAIADAPAGMLSTASAGHPPPLLVRSGGSAEYVDVRPGPPLLVLSGPPEVASTPIRQGDVVVMYSDGLVERRGEAIDVGLERLREVCGRVGVDDVEQLADAILEISTGDDDVALLLAKVR